MIAGIFVGGRSTRMGGVPKGLLVTADGASVVERLRGHFEALKIQAYLVGRNASYASLGMPVLLDDPNTTGPLAGLIALLNAARSGRAIAVACDMPYLSLERLASLVHAEEEAPILAPQLNGLWEPFFARYDARQVVPIATALARRGVRSLQKLFEEARAVRLPVNPSDWLELRDWDRPEDVDIPGQELLQPPSRQRP